MSITVSAENHATNTIEASASYQLALHPENLAKRLSHIGDIVGYPITILSPHGIFDPMAETLTVSYTLYEDYGWQDVNYQKQVKNLHEALEIEACEIRGNAFFLKLNKSRSNRYDDLYLHILHSQASPSPKGLYCTLLKRTPQSLDPIGICDLTLLQRTDLLYRSGKHILKVGSPLCAEGYHEGLGLSVNLVRALQNQGVQVEHGVPYRGLRAHLDGDNIFHGFRIKDGFRGYGYGKVLLEAAFETAHALDYAGVAIKDTDDTTSKNKRQSFYAAHFGSFMPYGRVERKHHSMIYHFG